MAAVKLSRADSGGTGLAVASAGLIALAFAACVAGPLLDDRIPETLRHVDWLAYSNAARRFLDGEPLYIAQQLAGPYRMADVAGAGYVYPPPSILLFVPFLVVGPTIWVIANAVLFASGIGAMARRDFGRYAGLAFGVAMLLAAVSRPYLDAMLMGNVNLGLAGLFAWTWAFGRGSRPIGALAALGGVVKLHPLALVGWTRPPQAVRTIGWAIAVTLIVALATLPIVGIANWIDFVRATLNAQPLCGTGIDVVACRIMPTLGAFTTPALLAVSAVLVFAAIWTFHDAVAFGSIVVAVLIVHPELFWHTFLLVEVAGFAIACSFARRRLGRALTP